MPLEKGQHPVNVLTPAENSLGGSSSSPLKILANSVRRRKYCNVKCMFLDMCPVLPLAMSREERLPNGKQPCKLRDAPHAVQRRIKNMFLNGEEGLLLEIKQSLFVVSTNLGQDNKERMQFADSLMKLHKSVYGEKSQITASPEPLEITVRQLNTSGAQEITIGKEIRQANAAALIDRARILRDRSPPPEEPVDIDPETLLLSPIIDTFVHREKDDETGD